VHAVLAHLTDQLVAETHARSYLHYLGPGVKGVLAAHDIVYKLCLAAGARIHASTPPICAPAKIEAIVREEAKKMKIK